MRRGVVVALLMACAAGAGGGIWCQIALNRQQNNMSARKTEAVSAAGIADTYLAAAISSASQRSGIAKYAVTVERQETRKITSSSSRKVAEVLVKVGDAVKEGTALMRYDDENDEMTIQSHEYEIEKMKLDIETRNMSIQKAEAELPKLKDLDLEERKIQIQQTRNAILVDEYNIEAREKNIETLRQMTSEKEVKSKYDGIVTKIEKGNGNSDSDFDSDSDSSDVSQYTVTIAESSNLLLKGTATDANIANIFQGQSVVAYSRVDPSVCWFGMISKVKKPGEDKNKSSSDEEYSDSGSSSGSGNYTYYVELESEDGLLVGQHLYMEPDVGQTGREEGLWIGEEYVFSEDGQAYVWVENTSNRIEKRAVTISSPDDYGKVRIEEGLDKLEYIAENNGIVKEGMRTRHAEEIAAASGQQGASPNTSNIGVYEDEVFEEGGEPDFNFEADDWELGDTFLNFEDGGDDGDDYDDGGDWDAGDDFDDGGDWDAGDDFDDGGDWDDGDDWDDE